MQRITRGSRLAATDPWDVTWLLELTSGELVTLPEPYGRQRPAHIGDAERLATAVLDHLPGRSSKQNEAPR